MTAASSPPRATVFRLATLAIAGAARLVPVRRRAEWRREWEAELWYRVASLMERGDLDAVDQLRLLYRCLGAYRHALWVLGRELRPARLGASLAGAADEVRETPARSAIAVIGVGLALGAGGLAFTMADQARSGAAPYPGDGRTVRVFNTAPAADIERTGLSTHELTRFRADNRSFEVLAGFRRAHLTVEDQGVRRPVRGARVTPDWFRAVGVEPEASEASGPGFEAAGDQAAVVVLREDLWVELAGSGAPPRTITVNGEPLRVVGVLPATFRFPTAETKVWVPLPIAALSRRVGDRSLAVVGRLRSGVSAPEAGIDLQRLSFDLQAEHPEGYLAFYGIRWGVEVIPLNAVPREQVPLLVLLFGAGAMLMIAGATAAGVLVRQPAAGRPGALGSVLVVGAAALVAAGFLAAGLHLLSGGPGPGLHDGPGPAWRAAVYLAVSAALALGFRQLARRRWRDAALVALSVAFAIVLLAGVSLVGGAYRHLLETSPGYDPKGLVALRSLEGALDAGVARRAERVPGILGATLSSAAPGIEDAPGTTIELEDGPISGGPPPSADVRAVGTGYFGVMRIPLIAGRDFDMAPPEASGNEVIVNHTLAERFWPGGAALGHRLLVYMSGVPTPWLDVVGIASDVRRQGAAARPVAELYLPPGLRPGALSTLVVRTALPPDEVLPTLRQGGIVGEGAFSRPAAVQEIVRDAVAPYRVGTRMLGLVALIASLLALIACAAAPRRTALGGVCLGGLAGGLGVWMGAPAVQGMLGGSPTSPLGLGMGAVGITLAMLVPAAMFRRRQAVG